MALPQEPWKLVALGSPLAPPARPHRRRLGSPASWVVMMADGLETGTSIRSDISKQIALVAVAIYAIIVLVAVFTV
jgi:hypothetical protein